jgi:hypothetical protein
MTPITCTAHIQLLRTTQVFRVWKPIQIQFLSWIQADDGHSAILFINPRSTRDTSAFYTDAKNGELWVGRRFTTGEASERYGIEVREIAELEKFLKGQEGCGTSWL